MARRALLLLAAVVAALAVSATPLRASAGGGDDDELGVSGGMRRWLDDVNATDPATTNLMAIRFISYRALFASIVPCSVPGASYYNCWPGAEANSYQRGCSAITRCRG